MALESSKQGLAIPREEIRKMSGLHVLNNGSLVTPTADWGPIMLNLIQGPQKLDISQRNDANSDALWHAKLPMTQAYHLYMLKSGKQTVALPEIFQGTKHSLGFCLMQNTEDGMTVDPKTFIRFGALSKHNQAAASATLNPGNALAVALVEMEEAIGMEEIGLLQGDARKAMQLPANTPDLGRKIRAVLGAYEIALETPKIIL